MVRSALLVLGVWLVAAVASGCSSSASVPGAPLDGAAPPDGAGDAGGGGGPTDGPRLDAADGADAPSGADALAGPDATGQVDAAPAPQCAHDGDCPSPQGCYHGRCRHHCTLGTCLVAPAGEYCRDNYCVDCRTDADCAGSRYACDPVTYACVERPVDYSATQFGMFYSLWQCPFAADNPQGRTVYDISEVLAGRQSWGPLREFHWWDEPAAGYYCLARNDALLAQHATLLRDAGIQFIFIDATNHAYVDGRSDRTTEMIVDPLARLLAVWSAIPGAPRVAPWVPTPEAGTNPTLYTVDRLIQMLAAYPGMHYEYQGKPLVLVTENEMHVPSEAKLTALAASATVRRMWAHLADAGPKWSFMQYCQNDPTSGDPCAQRAAQASGTSEQLPIVTAYQWTYMSLPSAVPKHRGLTLRRQFETLLLNPQTPVATFASWNEWVVQRLPCDENPTCPCTTYPYGCFLDEWDVERSRDIEAGKNAMGDYYYRLVVDCIALYRSGQLCGPATATNLCCRDADV
jgi:hypothetical protein